ncbi:MAG: maleylacetoacetate isomerase [Hyphomonas sp.]|uniref:maleylacetoacetate isomerase n=1 Tax=Hyphomonas sp. TaxID=87 RepID=UPI0017E1D845|nr:maleylacetoacetate isomerase [Hyphomonas sp.]MBU3920596.1 maleylacetoacetate isomerase [Alphaproteobacteria bacterium]MBA3067207.1 maleylacetoacetate isomerase [Hyphomonas sp.]MBU4061183.1 maleylacetoacetate isomerase [Alphaproteobacteria bacterium]MBU4165095.1 maleylacetoacetate isomerase [Alphaproteobacteria bacterium]MBU4568867.1 maleylacetoacetate isomerase [Alphaproteobacteria bacterium]
MIRLYDYWRSSAAYRVRIALNLKGAPYERVPVNILPGADEQLGAEYRARNPQMRVPAIEVDGRMAGQSLAIIEWMDETLPGPALLPKDPWQRLQARAFANIIACDIHPLNNLSPLAVLRKDFGADEAAIGRWYRDWIVRGFTALEAMASDIKSGPFLFGDTPGLAEIVLVPQVANAHRFETDLTPFPLLVELDARCRALEPFRQAAPESLT